MDQQLQACMDQETCLYGELRDCLLKEQQAILAHETDALLSLVMEKDLVLQQLQRARQSRQARLQQLTGSDQAVAPGGLRENVQRHQRALEGLGRHIALVNGQNRRMIYDMLDILDEFVDIAFGGRPEPTVYQSKGLISKGKKPARFNLQV